MTNKKIWLGMAVIIGLVVTNCDNLENNLENLDNHDNLAHTHEWGDWSVINAATCTTKGAEIRVCNLDPTHEETRDIPIDPDAHEWGEWTEITPPTFIEPGVETRICNHSETDTETKEGDPALPICSIDGWETALEQLNEKTGSYTLTISGDIGLAESTADNFGTTTADSLSVTLKGSGKLYLIRQGSIIRIGANQTLIIDSEDLILEGLTDGKNDATQDNNTSIVYVGTDGNLELKNGTISGNNVNDTSYGGGVYVNGTFTMTGGEISGNTAKYGGGVYVNEGIFTMNGGRIFGNGNSSTFNGGGVNVWEGIFTMNSGEISGNEALFGGGVNTDFGIFIMYGGEISDNEALYDGGGVYVYKEATFYIVTGTIYGSDADEGVKNISVSNEGAALNNGGTAQYGTFSGEDWNSSGDLATTNDTININNGYSGSLD